MSRFTGRDVKDFSISMRDLSVLSWRLISKDSSGRPLAYRSTGAVAGFSSTVLKTLAYHPASDTVLGGLLDTTTFDISGPDVDAGGLPTNHTLQLISIYQNGEKIGEDVKLDGVLSSYVPNGQEVPFGPGPAPSSSSSSPPIVFPTVTLDASTVSAKEVSPGVVRVTAPNSAAYASVVLGFMDGQAKPEGSSWQRSSDLTSFEFWFPTDSQERAVWLANPPSWDLMWFPA